MTALLVDNIGELTTNDPALGEGLLGLQTDAALVIQDGRIAWVGAAAAAPPVDERVDVEGAAVLPGFVDSHTHLVFDGDRADEFAARMAGRPYAAGGIATTVAATRAASDDRLHRNTSRLLAEARAGGTTTIEIKSGYGLDVDTERRLLQVARTFTQETTFLGAHVVPAGVDRWEYLDLVCGPMLDACAPLARWVDVFCDRGAFDEAESRRVLRAGMAAGLQPRLHGNQLQPGPGVQLAVEINAASVDHCTFTSDADVAALAGSETVATLLPAAEFSTRAPYPDARRLLDAGVVVALASDCNPGSAYTTSLPFCIAIAVREMGMTLAEAVHAATAGGARALRRTDIGTLTVGARADLLVLAAPSHVHLAYRPGVSLVSRVWQDGAAVPYTDSR